LVSSQAPLPALLIFQDDLNVLFDAAVREGAQALVTGGGGANVPPPRGAGRPVGEHGLASMHYTREFVEAGGLMAHAPSLLGNYRRAVVFIDKIFKGTAPADLPGDLPIEQPTKFGLVINLKTAKALGLTMPPSLLLQADQVIEE
jgi:putative ABC transport system substrate-binding protein